MRSLLGSLEADPPWPPLSTRLKAYLVSSLEIDAPPSLPGMRRRPRQSNRWQRAPHSWVRSPLMSSSPQQLTVFASQLILVSKNSPLNFVPAVLGTRTDSRHDIIMAGMALANVLLVATSRGLTHSYLCQVHPNPSPPCHLSLTPLFSPSSTPVFVANLPPS